MKENFTAINVIIDASGSMQSLSKDTIGSFNQFLAEQKIVPGDAVFTLCSFNTDYKLIHDFVKLAGVPNLDAKAYSPGGGTALLDAMGTTINSVGQKLAAMKETERPSKVIFLIITDGEENSSRTFSLEQIKSMVQHQSDTYSWQFVFMGANIDAFATGGGMGIARGSTLSYNATSVGTKSLYRTVSDGLSDYRLGNNAKVDFFDQSKETPEDPKGSSSKP